MPLRQRGPIVSRRYAQQQGGGDVERGLQVGSQIGKMLGGLGGAIKSAQDSAKMDAVANQLMNQGPTGQDPRVQDLGIMPGGDGSSQDLGTMPAQTFTNPSSGNVEPLQGQDDTMTMPASTGSGATAGSLANAQPSSTDDNWNLARDTGSTSLPGEGGPMGPTVGSLIHSGGTAELAARQAFQKNALADAIAKANLAKGPLSVALDQAKLADYQAKAAGTGGYAKTAKTGGKPAAYAPGSGDIQNDESTDNMSQIRSDFDEYHGKGAFDKFQANISNIANLQPQADGSYSAPGSNLKRNKDGSFSLLDKNDNPTASVSQSDADLYLQRVNATRLKSGMSPIQYGLPGGVNPSASGAPGTLQNPFNTQNNVAIRSVPYGTYVMVNGKPMLKQKPPTVGK